MGRHLGIDFGWIWVGFGEQVGKENRTKIDPKKHRKYDPKQEPFRTRLGGVLIAFWFILAPQNPSKSRPASPPKIPLGPGGIAHAPFSLLGRAKTFPRRPQDVPQTPQDAPRRIQDVPTRSPRRPKTPLRHAKASSRRGKIAQIVEITETFPRTANRGT